MRGGKVALSAHAPGKGHLLVQTLGPGETLGLSWLFPPYRWQFDARPVELGRDDRLGRAEYAS